MHTGWVKNKIHKTSTFKRTINGVDNYGYLEKVAQSVDKELLFVRFERVGPVRVPREGPDSRVRLKRMNELRI